MATNTSAAIRDFEVYLLMTMKPRLALADTWGLLDAKLAKAAISISGAKRISDRISQALSHEASRFRDLTALLEVADAHVTSVSYHSVLWPGWNFSARASSNGGLESAGYTHLEHAALSVESPTHLAPWSVDIREFDELFGPSTVRDKRALFDTILPAYEEYEFSWNGDRYGARFLWGLFLSSSAYWE